MNHDETIRAAVLAALAEIDRSFPDAQKSPGPLGDRLAGALHRLIESAIAEHVAE